MADDLLPPPPGYTVDQPDALLPPPPGYTVDQAQYQGDWRQPAITGSNLLKGAVTTVGMPGDIGDLGQSAFHKYVYDPYIHSAVAAGLSAIGLPEKQPPPGQEPFTPGPSPLGSTSLLAPFRAMGAVDNPALVPQNDLERYNAAISQGVGGAIPTMGVGGGVGGAIRSLVAGGVGGGAGEAAAEMFPNHPDLARATAALLAGGAVGGAPAAARGNVAQAADRLGMNLNLRGDLTGGWLPQMAQKTGAELVGGGRIRAAQEEAMNGWGNALDRIAGDLGTSQTPQQAGTALQMESQNWLDRFRTGSRTIWGDLDMHIPAATPTPLTNYSNTLTRVVDQMPDLPATAQRLTSDLPRGLMTDLIADTTRLGRAPGWQTVQGLRTRIGEALSDPQLIGDTGRTDLERIYAALSEDMQAAARRQGPAAVDAFDRASAFTRNGHDFIDNTISKVYAPRLGIDPERAYNTAMSGSGTGGTFLQSVRDRMPDAADELAAAKLRQMGQATPGTMIPGVPGAPGTRMISPSTFVTNTNPGRLSQEATDALFPGISQELNDLRTVGGAMKNTERAVNTSGTGRFGAFKEALSAPVLAASTGYGTYEATGSIPKALAAAGVAAGSPLAGGYLAGRFATRLPRSYLDLPAATALTQYPQVQGLLTPAMQYSWAGPTQ